MIASHHKL